MERNCRMCLVKDKLNQFQDFELKLEDNLSVHDYYKIFTSVNLRNQDERTKSKICHKCLQKLLFFYKDRCQAITNNEIISKWYDEGEFLSILIKFFIIFHHQIFVIQLMQKKKQK